MAKEKSYTSYQKGIIKRYYDNKDNLMAQKLGEIVSDLYLADTEKKKIRLWKSAHTALVNAGAHKVEAQRICDAQDLEKLATLVSQLF